MRTRLNEQRRQNDQNTLKTLIQVTNAGARMTPNQALYGLKSGDRPEIRQPLKMHKFKIFRTKICHPQESNPRHFTTKRPL